MNPEVPKSLDWVKARAECSIEKLFILLTAVIKGDTKAANVRSGDVMSFEVTFNTDGLLVVRTRRAGFIESVAVAFERMRDGSISVTRRTSRDSTNLFVAKPHVDVNGNCRFQIDYGEALEPWQVSKRALEDLFFEHGLSPNAG